MKQLRWMMVFVMTLAVAGCSAQVDDETATADGAEEAEQTEQTESEDKQSAVGQVIDQATGIRAAQEGQKIKGKIGDIEEQRNRDIQEALEQE